MEEKRIPAPCASKCPLEQAPVYLYCKAMRDLLLEWLADTKSNIIKFYKKRWPLFIVLLGILVLMGVFFIRSPVLIVTDASFYQIYGSRRSGMALLRNSILLFRRVVPVPVSEHAGADVIALVVEAASRSPRAVLFPGRYIDGARIYNSRRPDVPVLVMLGRNPLPHDSFRDPGLIFVQTDNATDLYRAGLSSALLMGETRGVIFFYDENFQDQYRQAFQDGLQNQGFAGNPFFHNTFIDHHSFADIGSVVVAGPAFRFLERGLDIPVILFSWVDPSLTPRAVKMVFDDSPMALAARALRASPVEGEVMIPSRPTVLLDRIEERSDFRKLRRLVRENFQNI